MANEEQLRILKQGVETWNRWREENLDAHVDLSSADLSQARLGQAYLSEADLTRTLLRGAYLIRAHLDGAHLNQADLSGAYLMEADLRNARLTGAHLNAARLAGALLNGAHLNQADLRKAILIRADLRGANLTEANLCEANLEGALLLNTILDAADLTACRVYGVSAWDIQLEKAIQKDLIITPSSEPAITVDNLEVAQFIHLLLNKKKIRDVIDTITSKVVLILGRFAPERKAILDALRETLRQRNYVPVLFDFDKPASRDLTETISTLAHLARFVIADITDPKSIPQELQAIVPDLAVPIQPIIASPNHPWGMFEDFPKKYHWVLAVHEYSDLDDLLTALETKVIAPAEAKAKELMGR